MKSPMEDIQRLLQRQEFKSESELNEFLKKLSEGPIPTIASNQLTPQEKAQDLVEEAYNLSPALARKNIDKALKIDPDCIDAYIFLANTQPNPEIALTYYEKGISIGKRMFGGKYLEKNIGNFWYIYETRPFMRCLFCYSDLLYILGNTKESVEVLEEIILLNPGDNQGARYNLMMYLIELNDLDKYQHYQKMYDDDYSAYTFYNQALFLFIKEGESTEANKQLKEAISYNKFVPKHLLSKTPVRDFPSFYGIGDENEAKYYAIYGRGVWRRTAGAIEWLAKNTTQKSPAA